MTRKDRWILSEYRVACDREKNFPEKLIRHRLKTPYAEIDLVFETRTETGARAFSVIEVKSSDGNLWGRPALTARQRLRLERARLWLESRSASRVRLFLACVTARGSVTYFEAPF